MTLLLSELTDLPAQAVLIAIKMLTESWRHLRRARNHRCPQQLEASARWRCWGGSERSSHSGGMWGAPRKLAGCCQAGCWGCRGAPAAQGSWVPGAQQQSWQLACKQWVFLQGWENGGGDLSWVS